MESDESLLARSSDDPGAFEPLVQRHSRSLHAYLARRVPAMADDLLSEAWLDAYAGRATFDPSRGPVRGWLFGVARHTLMRHLRRPVAIPLGYRSDDTSWEDVDTRLDAARAAPALHAAISALPESERELLLLVALDQLTPTEAATAIGIPAGTARSRLHRARERVRAQLNDPTLTTMATPGAPS